MTGHAQAVSITPPGRANLTEGGLRYGIFQQCSTGTADFRRDPRIRSRYLGRDQPDGRIRQRQPCDTFVSEKLAHKVEGHWPEIFGELIFRLVK